MQVTVVHPDSGWVLSTIARRVCQAQPDTFHAEAYAKGEFLSRPADVVLHVDVQNTWHSTMVGRPPGALHVGLFTHLDRNSIDAYRPHWSGLDGVVHMCQRYFDAFVHEGWYPPERMTVLRPGEVCQIPLKPLRLGVCQRGEHVGKGRDFLPAVLAQLTPEVRAGLHLVFCGKGWGTPFHEKCGYGDYHGVCVTYLPEKAYATLSDLVDVYLIPSLWEGGPMSLLEALAAGLPVIAADVGWVPDLYRDLQQTLGHHPPGFYTFPPGDALALCGLLLHWIMPRLDRRAVVAGMSYQAYAADLLAFCERLKEMPHG